MITFPPLFLCSSFTQSILRRLRYSCKHIIKKLPVYKICQDKMSKANCPAFLLSIQRESRWIIKHAGFSLTEHYQIERTRIMWNNTRTISSCWNLALLSVIRVYIQPDVKHWKVFPSDTPCRNTCVRVGGGAGRTISQWETTHGDRNTNREAAKTQWACLFRRVA